MLNKFFQLITMKFQCIKITKTKKKHGTTIIEQMKLVLRGTLEKYF